jgi:hypothetical protein
VPDFVLRRVAAIGTAPAQFALNRGESDAARCRLNDDEVADGGMYPMIASAVKYCIQIDAARWG